MSSDSGVTLVKKSKKGGIREVKESYYTETPFNLAPVRPKYIPSPECNLGRK